MGGETPIRSTTTEKKQANCFSWAGEIRPSIQAVHHDAVIRTIVILFVTLKDIGYGADDALWARVVLACRGHSTSA